MSDLEKIKNMIENGFSVIKISYILRIKKDIVKNIISNNGFCLIHEKFDENKIDKIISLYKEGISAKALG